ncbi:E3 ubiquitin-protein ligase HUWE1 isoform X4 [Neocloeon triangulifer]|uniref:E3 ubiquitin-protein ligase HUWE1 isoform X4 n=1 Tax=Neocloeon triangulifer TaxID=2078957 RepID=UPI00286F03E4|nr:E3 ubiquitin-protein ligase HUWE1 isoform X4 [Neocloeon triangulifer]
MKIDRTKLKKSPSEVPLECRQLIQTLRSCKDDNELLQELRKIESWTFGKCELFHWTDILDICDGVLERATTPNSWLIACDEPENQQLKDLLLCVLHFTTLLIEHSFSRHLYNSMEHLITLLSSSDMNVTLAVLNLLYMFSKRSNFIPRLNAGKKYGIIRRLTHLAESWGGKENGYGLADCCRDLPTSHFPAGATSLHFEYFNNPLTENEAKFQKYMKSSCSSNTIITIHLDDVDKINKPLGVIMEDLVSTYNVPIDKQVLLFTHLRLAHCFGTLAGRLKCVQVRLQALSVLIYSNALMENAHQLLYSNLLEEIVEVLEMQDPALVEIKAAALRTLTAIIHLDRNPHMSSFSRNCRLNTIIDVTGASSYHGFLPVLVRSCIQALTAAPQSDSQLLSSTSTAVPPSTFPLPLATALFSFLYHLASYEPGGEALVSCNMMESLLKVIKWPGSEIEHITFVTRAVRVIDLMTNTDMQSFEVHGGLNTFINRLECEVNICRTEQPFVIIPESSNQNQEGMMDISRESSVENSPRSPENNEEVASPVRLMDPSLSKGSPLHCLPQRAALLKSMLNFLKKAIQDPTFSDSIRHVMDGSLPSTLKHIISNAEYYGPSLFLLATDVVTVYVFQEPSLLTSLQDNGLTDVMLHALLVRKVPATREVLGSLPNVFSALCLNARGLAAFVKCCPFEQMFKVLLSPKYLAAMRRRRSSDPMGDTASNLGNAMDELMRHQPSLKKDATLAIIKLLQELCNLGTDPKYVCWRPQKKQEVPAAMLRSGSRGGSSDDEEEEDDDENTQSRGEEEQPIEEGQERIAVPLVDYIVNVMKFVDSILSNNSTDDHVREFKEQGGLKPLISLLGLPNLPVDCTLQLSSQAVSTVCKSIMNLSHESEVLSEGFRQVDPILRRLYKLLDAVSSNEIKTSTVLLKELSSVPDIKEAFTYPDQTPAIHAFAALNDFMVMFTHVCRTAQADIRGLNLSMWGCQEGSKVLDKLVVIYDHIVWESTALLVLRSNENFDITGHFGKEDLPKLASADDVPVTKGKSSSKSLISEIDSNSSDKDSYPEVFRKETRMQTLGKSSGLSDAQLSNLSKLVEPTIRLRQSMSDFFSFLVKLCVGTPLRQRRGQAGGNSPFVATAQSCAVATRLGAVIKNAVWYKKFLQAPYDYLTVKYLISSITFVTPMLLDEKRAPYHLMLNEFIANGGYLRFFETFRWVLCADVSMVDIVKEKYVLSNFHPPNIPWLPICSEFVESWLELLEKLVNPKSVLESPHSLSVKANSQLSHPFEPSEYITYMQKLAFDSLMLLWNLDPRSQILSSPNVIPLMLHIWQHVLKSEEILDELKKDKNKDVAPAVGASSTTTATNSAEVEPEVSAEHLNRLIDMGFSRAMSIQALRISPTVEQATEYLLSAPSMGMEIDVSEEDQMHQAIAMSLGENSDKSAGAKTIEKIPAAEQKPEPLTKEEIYKFTMAAPEVCLKMLDTINSSATLKACDLLVMIAKRNGEEFRKQMLNTILRETSECIKLFLEQVKDVTDSKKYLIIQSDSRESGRTADLLKFFSLLFEEMKIPSCVAMEETGIIEQLIALMSPCLPHITFESTPKWLGPIFQILDQYERVAISLERQDAMHKICGRQWKWYDISTSKWCTYSAPYNKIINDAYWSGEQCVRINYGRRKYTLQFSTMYQCNDDTGNRRPIMLCLIDSKKDKEPKTEAEENEASPKKMEVDSSPPKPSDAEENMSEKLKADEKKIKGIGEIYSKVLIKACIKLLSVPVCPDALQSMMKVLVRITRNYKCAQIFFENGGIWKLLMLKNLHHFLGAINLITIVIRHTVEEPKVLKLAMEKVLRAKTQANIPHYYKELFYLLRICGNAVCRAPETFLQLCKESLRADTNISPRRNEEEDMPIICTTGPVKHKAMSENNGLSAAVVNELLDALLQQMAQASDSSKSKDKNKEKEETPSTSTKPNKRTFSAPPPPPSSVRHSIRSRNLTAVAPSRVQNQLGAILGEFHLQDAEEKAITVRKRPTSEETGKPLVPCSALLKILAELVRSYNHVGKIIADYQHPKEGSVPRQEGSAPVPRQEGSTPTTNPAATGVQQQSFSAVHYIIEHLFDACADLECHNMVRMLISALASCSFSSDIQTHVVMEVKAALHRALSMPESNSKHTEVQEICNLISVMIDSCPSPVPPCPYAILGSVDKPPCNVTANSIVRIMIRKGILTDLSRIPYSLDLSSPNLQATVNGLIKPLETLTRIVIHPPATVKDGKKSKVAGQDAGSQTSRNSASGTSRRTQSTSESMGLEELMEHLMESARDGSVVQDIMEFSVSDERPRHNMNRAHSDDVHLYDEIQAALNAPESPSSRQWEESDSNYDDDEDNHDEEQREEAAAAAAASALDNHGGNHEDEEEDDEMDEDEEEEDDIDDDDEEEEEEDEESEEEDAVTNNDLPGFLNIGVNAHPPHHHHHGQQQQNPLVAFRGSLDSDNVGGLQRQNATRSQRSSLQRRYLAHLHSRGPAILQRIRIVNRLLGPEPLSLGESRHGPLPVIESLTLLDEDDGEDTGAYLFGTNLASTANNIPNALHWWNEEGKLLDGDSMPACSIVLASKIVKQLEQQRDKDVTEKKKKLAEEALKISKSSEAVKDKMETETTPSETPPQQPAALQASAPSSQLQDLQLIASEVSNIVDTVFRTAQTLTSTDTDQTNSTTSEMPPSESAPAEHEQTQTENTVSSLTPTDSCDVGQRDELSAASPMTPVPASQNTENDFSENMHTSPPPTDVEKSEVEPAKDDTTSSNTDDNSAVSPMDQQESTPAAEKVLELVTPPTENNAEAVAVEERASNEESMQASNYEPLDYDTINSWFGSARPTENIGESGAAATSDQATVGSAEAAPGTTSTGETPGTSSTSATASTSNGTEAELPEGVDPSFLAALPEEMRQEVIAEQLRLQRLRRARTAPQETADVETPLEVNPEFLAALPPNIQEEVLTQQRLEEQRRAAAAANPNDPVDAAAFFQNLPSSLRQAILTDMEESQISVLPPELAAEAQTLRRDWEARNRQIMQERFLNHVSQSNNTLSSILRNSVGIIEGRMPSRYISSVPPRAWGQWSRSTPGNTDNLRTACSYLTKWKGKQVLDQEAITCLLVLLFIEDPKLNITRLQRVLRHLCWHAETRDWVIGSLISILEMCNDCYEASLADSSLFAKPRQSSISKTPAWLNITMDAALGSRTNVFNIQRPSLGKRSANGERSPNCSISIHPQAASSVANRVLDTLIFIGEAFPEYFLPHRFKDHNSPKSEGSGSQDAAPGKPDFWETLIKLDTVSALKNSKSLHKWQHSTENESQIPFMDTCHFRRFVPFLSFPLILRSPQLIDSTICLLYQVSTGLVNECAVRVNIIPGDGQVPTTESEESRASSPTRQFAQYSTRLRALKVPPKYSVNTKGTPKGHYPYIPTYIREVDIPERHLKLLIDVLIGKTCLENGLKNAKIFLNNLCRGPEATKDMVIKLLMDGVKQIGCTVENDISILLGELKQHCTSPTKKSDKGDGDDELRNDRIHKGKLADRFTNSTVIVNAPSKVSATTSHDLQLPSIALLTSKTSSQSSFLRLLKVLIDLRSKYNKKGSKHLQNHPGYVFVPVTTEVVCSSSEEDTEDYEPQAEREVTSVSAPPATASSTSQTKEVDFSKPEYGTPREESLPLSQELGLDSLWDVLSQCLTELENNQDQHAVLILQPAVEAFFYVHSSLEDSKNAAATTEPAETQTVEQQDAANETTGEDTATAAETAEPQASQEVANAESAEAKSASESANLSPDMRKFLSFAEMHRTVLNQILRQTNTHLADGPFSVLAQHTRILDFDVKRRYFRTELDRLDEGIRREELAVHVRRSNVFEDSFRELHRRSSEDWKNRFYIVFEGEEGQDAGGLLREWYVIISREIFNPMYALFTTSPGDRVTYMINSTSHCNPNHLSYFKFVGRVIAKAIYDNKLLECYFTRSFYKHILSKQVKYTDMESEDYSFYKGLEYLMEHNVSDLGYDLTFSTEVQEFGVTEVRDLIPNGRNVAVTEANKMDYISMVCQMKMTGAIQKQLNAFLEGFYDIIPKKLISIFNEQEMELLISGLPNVDIEDLKANTEYHKYQSTSLQIQWFWRALRSFDQADRAKFLQFVTGTSKVPLQGFGALEGMNGVQKFQIHRDDRSTDRLPSAHTCFNQLDLPVYETYDKLKSYLLKAIHECSEGFGFA